MGLSTGSMSAQDELAPVWFKMWYRTVNMSMKGSWHVGCQLISCLFLKHYSTSSERGSITQKCSSYVKHVTEECEEVSADHLIKYI